MPGVCGSNETMNVADNASEATNVPRPTVPDTSPRRSAST